MKPSNQRLALMLIPVGIYCAALGWHFIAGLTGAIEKCVPHSFLSYLEK